MDYYDRRKQATDLISELIKNGVDTEHILLVIEEKYGFGERFTNGYISRLVKANYIVANNKGGFDIVKQI